MTRARWPYVRPTARLLITRTAIESEGKYPGTPPPPSGKSVPQNSRSGNTVCQNRVMTERAYGGVSAERRRAARRQALLAAGLDILGTDGHRRLTVGRLCATAGLNERYFYENFADSDELVVAVFDEGIAEGSTAIVDAVAGAPAEARAKARAAIAAAVELLTDDPRKTRLVFVEALTVPVLAGRRAEVGRSFVALIVGQAHDFY